MFTRTDTLERRVETRPFPLDRVVKWLPRDDAFYLLAAVMTSASAEPVVVTREALLEVERHLREPDGARGCGLLLGARCVCPKTRIQYVLIEDAVRAVTAITEQESVAATVARLRTLVAEVERRGTRVVGWFRGGAVLALRVSSRDMAVHRELFPESWRVALLRDGVGSGRAGAFVRVEPVEERAYHLPFHEVLPRARKRDREAGRTAVAWRNYRAEGEAEVVPLAEVTAVPNGSGDGAPLTRAVDPVVEARSILGDLDPRVRGDDGERTGRTPLDPCLRRDDSALVNRPTQPLGRHSRERGDPVAFAPLPAPSSPPSPVVVTPAQAEIQSPADSSEDFRSAAPREPEAAPESVAAPAPPEPLEFIWVPPRVPAGGSVEETPWRIWLWSAAAAVALVVLLLLWRLTR